MEVDVVRNKKVALGSLRWGEGFLDLNGDPFIKLDPNSNHFKIQRTSTDRLETPVVRVGDGEEPFFLTHLSRDARVTPCDVKMTFTERAV